jgi:hypothetical protein
MTENELYIYFLQALCLIMQVKFVRREFEIAHFLFC